MKTYNLALIFAIAALISACSPGAPRDTSGTHTHLPTPISFHLVTDQSGHGTAEVALPGTSGPVLYDSTPAMTITSVTAISWGISRSISILDGKRTERDAPTIDITMNEVDARDFETLTSANVGKSLLIMWGNDPLAAPRIREAITSGNVCWNVESNQHDIAERHLKELNQK